PPAADLTQFHAPEPPGVAVLLLQRAQGFLHLFLRAVHGGGQCRCRQRLGDHHQHRFHRTQEPFVLGAGPTGLAHSSSSSACPAVVSAVVSFASVPVWSASASWSKSSEMVTSPLSSPVQCTVRSPNGPAWSKPTAPCRYSSSRARNRATTTVVVSARSVSARPEGCCGRLSRSVICAA